MWSSKSCCWMFSSLIFIDKLLRVFWITECYQHQTFFVEFRWYLSYPNWPCYPQILILPVFVLREKSHHLQLWPWDSVHCCSALNSSSVQVRLADAQVHRTPTSTMSQNNVRRQSHCPSILETENEPLSWDYTSDTLWFGSDLSPVLDV